MLRTQLQRKIPGYKVLGLFTLILLALLALFPSPSLVAPANDSTGFIFTLLSSSAGNPWFIITVAMLCLLPLAYKKDKKNLPNLMVSICLNFSVKLCGQIHHEAHYRSASSLYA